MRIALISDIHANMVALEAALADINRRGVDRIVCLGDTITHGPQPRQVLTRLEALDCDCVLGNHDHDVLNPDLAHEDGTISSWEAELLEWCAVQLSEADLNYLRSFRSSMEIPFDAQESLLCCHGSPRSHSDFILATTPATELDEMLGDFAATVLAIGHSHVQLLRYHKGKRIVNVGSVGGPLAHMPFKRLPCFLPWAEHAFIEWADGVLGIELRRVPIDFEAVKEAAMRSSMPRAASWVELWATPPGEERSQT